MFKNWFSSKTRLTSCNFQDLALTKLTEIVTNLIFNQWLLSTTCSTEHEATSTSKFIEDLAQRVISTAEAIAQLYLQKANDDKKKILCNGNKFKKPPTVNIVVTAIESRQVNIIQRAQFNIEQQLKSYFPSNHFQPQANV